MRNFRFTVAISILSFALGFGITRAQDKTERDRLTTRAQEVNRTASKVGMKMALERVSTETGVPLEQVQTLHKQHPQAGAAGILLSCVMADETKQPAEQFLRNSSQKTWPKQAAENHVSVEKLIERLDRLEKAMAPSERNSEKPPPRKK